MNEELIITRMFTPAPAIVWIAWTDPEQVKQWWGPKNFTMSVCKIDLRLNGGYIFCLRSPEGRDYWSTGSYQEIIPTGRLVYTDSFSDEQGNIVPASYYGMDEELPIEMMVNVTFEEHEGGTKLTLLHSGFPTGEDRDAATRGWNESFDKLENFFKSNPEKPLL